MDQAMTIDEALGAITRPDPVLAEQAVSVAVEEGAAMGPAEALLFPEASWTAPANWVLDRLARIFASAPDHSVGRLTGLIRDGPWSVKTRAAACMRDLAQADAAPPLLKLLRHGDFDVNRAAIDALGYVGADNWTSEIRAVVVGSGSYSVQKLFPNALSALTRMLAQESDPERAFYDLTAIEGLIRAVREEDDETRSVEAAVGDMADLLAESSPAIADALVHEWAGHPDPMFRQIAAEGMRGLCLRWFVTPLRERLLAPGETAAVKAAAASALAELSGPAARELALEVLAASGSLGDDPASRRARENAALAAASLLAEPGSPEPDEATLGDLLSRGPTTRAHTLYSLGVGGWRPDLIEDGLLAADPYVRGCAALGLVQFESARAASLRPMHREAADDFERLAIATALTRAGLLGGTDDLHRELCRPFHGAHLLRRRWRQEIIMAFAVGGAAAHERLLAWSRILRLDPGATAVEMEIEGAGVMSNAEELMSEPVVFIVHGHDHALRNAIDLFLRDEGIATQVMQALPSAGLTLPEKFEQAAERCSFAVFILSGDDLLLDRKENREIRRARQNVILEIGYFWGRLGRRGHVAFLVEEGVELPTDVAGIGWIPITSDLGETKLQLLKELKSAGVHGAAG
jgi:hypothetical protein